MKVLSVCINNLLEEFRLLDQISDLFLKTISYKKYSLMKTAYINSQYFSFFSDAKFGRVDGVLLINC